MIIKRKRKRSWRVSAPERESAARKASEAAHGALPSPKPGTPEHAIWRDMLGLPDRPPEPLPQRAEEAANYIDPQERLARATDSLIEAMVSVGKGNAQQAAKGPVPESKTEQHKRVEAACSQILTPPYGKHYHQIIRAAMIRVGVEPSKKNIWAFERYLRRRDASTPAKFDPIHLQLLGECQRAAVRTTPPFSRQDKAAIQRVMIASTAPPTPPLIPFLAFLDRYSKT